MTRIKLTTTRILFISTVIFLSSCKKKTDFMDLNLTGKWYLASYNTGDGIFFTFSDHNFVTFVDKGDNSSYEDDQKISGNTRIINDVIRLGSHRFKIAAYPAPYSGTIFMAGLTKPVTWKMTIKLGKLSTVDWGKCPSIDFYREY